MKKRYRPPHLPNWPKLFITKRGKIIVQGQHETPWRVTVSFSLCHLFLLYFVLFPITYPISCRTILWVLDQVLPTAARPYVSYVWFHWVTIFEGYDLGVKIWMGGFAYMILIAIMLSAAPRIVNWLYRLPCRLFFRKKTKVIFTETAVLIPKWLFFKKRFQRSADIEITFWQKEALTAQNIQRLAKKPQQEDHFKTERYLMWSESRSVIMLYGKHTIKITTCTKPETAEKMVTVLQTAFALSLHPEEAEKTMIHSAKTSHPETPLNLPE